MSMKCLMLMLLALTLLAGDPAGAAQFCVADGNALQAALTTASTNGQDDDIRLRGGVYSRVSAANAFTYSSAENFDLTVSGGWNSVCNNFFHDTNTSILDGGDARRVMQLVNTGTGSAVTHSVSRLVFQNGLANGDGGGLQIGGFALNGVEMLVRNSTFVANVASTFGGGLSASGNGPMRINNSLFLVNEAGIAFGAAALTSNDGVAYVVNNTILGNDAPSVGGLRYAGSSQLELANNILWANSDLDLIVQVAAHNRYHNNIGTLSAPVPGVLIGEIYTAPEFQPGLLNFDPRPGGALFNGGDPAPPGGLALRDLLGRPRVDAGRVDIGAYEAEVLFYDGFDP
jgi:hypothetical protein